MKLLILLLFVSFSVGASEVEILLEKKDANFTILRKFYSSLLANVRTQNDQLFCTNISNSVPTLTAIFEDDQLLVRALRRIQDPDFHEYAKHVDDNSRSPLFSYSSYVSLCDPRDRQSILSLVKSLEYYVMNVDYLSMSNLLFWQSIKTQTSH